MTVQPEDSTITTDVEDVEYDTASAVEEYLKRLGEDEETLSSDAEEETTEVEAAEVDTDDEEDNLELEDDESQEDPEKVPAQKPTKIAEDDSEVVYEVDGQEHRVSVKDLKRLAGQEASLTRKSQEVASVRKTADEQSMAALGVLSKLFEKATEEATPYENVDLFKASRELDAETFDTLRTEMERAKANKAFFENELGAYVQNLKTQRDTFLKQEAAKALQAVKVKIPEWSDTLYNNIRTYAISEGMAADVVNNIADPAALVLLHKARLYDQAKAKTASKMVNAESSVPKKTIKPTASKPQASPEKASVKRATQRFEQTGHQDDAVALMMARMG